MGITELLPIITPALVVVAVAIRLTTRERGDHDVILDLRDVPTVVLATPARAVPGPTCTRPVGGALVDPRGGGSLGARLRTVEPVHPVAQPAGAAPHRVVRVRRRVQPLVAVSREASRG